MIRHHHSSSREGVVTGVLGALAVAVLFLIRDLTLGVPFLTPSVLGQVILQGATTPITDRALPGAVVAYTVLHFAAFVLFGMVLAGLVRTATTQPSLRFALVMLFIFFEFFFTGVSFMFFEATQALFPLAFVLFANLLAGSVMAVYLWRHHPALRRAVHRDPLGLGMPHGHR
jgi:hypothetical protein